MVTNVSYNINVTRLREILNKLQTFDDRIRSSFTLEEINELLLTALNNQKEQSDEYIFYLNLCFASYYHKKLQTIEAEKYLAKANKIHCKELGYLSKIHLYLENAYHNFMKNNIHQAISYLNLVEEFYINNEEYNHLARIYHEAIIYLEKNDGGLNQVQDYLNKTLKILTQFENESSIIWYNGVATSFINYFENFSEGIKYYLHSLKLCKKYKNLDMEIFNLYCIGTDYLELHQKYDEGLRYLLPLLEKEKWGQVNFDVKCATLVSICYAYVGKKTHDKVVFYFQMLEDLIENEGKDSPFYEQIRAASLNLKCKIYFNHLTGNLLLDMLEESQFLYEKNKRIFRFIHFDVEIKLLRGDIYYKMGNYHQAMTEIYEALALAQTYGRTNFMIDCHKKLSSIYEALNLYEESIDAFHKYDVANNEWRKKISISTYESLHKDFETEEQDYQISLLNKVNDELNEKNNYDGLTQVYNRRFLDDYLSNSKVTSEAISFLMLDIDCFKLYNDYYGHLPGDDILKEVANTLTKVCVRKSDQIIRYGGEEFLIILENTDKIGIDTVAKKILTQIELLNMPHLYSTVESRITVSMGGATIIPTSKLDYYFLIEQADAALYHSKHHGRNQYTDFDTVLEFQKDS